MNDLINWCWPMNVHWFILFIIVGVGLTIVSWFKTQDGYSTMSMGIEKTHPVLTFFRAVGSLFVTVVTLSFIVWCIYACQQTPEVGHEERLEIRSVTYPNGRVVQMFSCEGNNYNANAMFSSAPPDGSYVRRLIYKRVYSGVYFPQMDRNSTSLRDLFILVTPDKAEQKASNVTRGEWSEK